MTGFDITSLQSTLQFVVYGGGSALIVGVLLSAYGERWAWFKTLEPEGKALFQKAGSALLAVIAWALMTYLPANIIAWATIPFGIAMVAAGASTVNQLSHAIRNINHSTKVLTVTNVTAVQAPPET